MSAISSNNELSENGQGILARFGKYSWSLVLVGLIGGPISTYFLTREQFTVALSLASERIAVVEARTEKNEKKLEEVVPKDVHETRWKMQEDVERWKERYYETQLQNLQRQLDEKRK